MTCIRKFYGSLSLKYEYPYPYIHNKQHFVSAKMTLVFYALHHATRLDLIRQLTCWVGSEFTYRGGQINTGMYWLKKRKESRWQLMCMLSSTVSRSTTIRATSKEVLQV
jgi:hypothetical protein